MSEENNTDTQNAGLYTKSVALEARSLEKQADVLMDDLFSDIDMLLEGNGQLPTQTAKAEYVTLQSVVVPSITLPSGEAKSGENRIQSENRKKKPRSRFSFKKNKAKKAQSSSTENKSSFQIPQHTDKILFGVACLSLLGVGIWFLTRGGLEMKVPLVEPNLPTPGNESKNPVIPSSKDAPFIEYMLRSLKVIASKPETPQAQNTASLPSPEGDRGSQASANGSSTPQVIERVYIPVYPPNANSTTSNNLSEAVVPPQPSPTPSATPTPSTTPTPSATPTPSTTPNPSPRNSQPKPRVSPTPVDTSKTVLPEPPQARLGAYRADDLPNFDELELPLETLKISPPVEESNNIELAGVLDAGDNSGALFRIENSTKRIAIGEVIGASGWSLVRIEGQTAVIRRNGEIRSVYVGQTF
ncbi:MULTISPECIES: hypothetical protein [Spirulina sp. CCY15215]|uniref:hypothetical protein n=1 Tax=Spirulina sp. CCY15215 TaxID=2767591 RepID=UPI001950409B|nr:hypothetical protein [Spirulina major]